MRRIAEIGGILLLCAMTAAPAAVEHLPTDVRAALEKTTDFQGVANVSAIPKAARDAFAREVREESFAMAEPGGKWQSTDVVLERGLPWRRLQTAAVSKDFLVLFYEKGGYAHSYHVCVFRLVGDGARLVWRANRPRDIANLDALNRAISSGAMDDDPKHLF